MAVMSSGQLTQEQQTIPHSIPPTPEEAAAYAIQAVIGTLNRLEIAPYPSYFSPDRLAVETWDVTAQRAGRIIMMSSAKPRALSEGMTQEQWDMLKDDAFYGHVASKVVLGARVLNEATKYEHKNLCLTMAEILLREMRNLEPYPEPASAWPER